MNGLVLLVSGKLVKLTTENKRYLYAKDVFFCFDGTLFFGNESKYGLSEIQRRLNEEDIALLKQEHIAKQSVVHQINLYKFSLKELTHLLILATGR